MCEAVGQENLGCATDFSSMSVRMGLLLGPVMGGLLYEYEGHFETFLPALVLVGAEVALRMLIIEDKKRDVTSASENTGAESGMENGTEKTGNPIKAGAIAATETQPLLRPPPRPTAPQNTIYRILLTNRAFLASLAAIFIHTSTTSAFSAILPPYISSTFALGPLPASILILTLILPTLYPPLTIALTSHFGTEHVALTGLAIGAPSLAALSLVGPGTASPMLKLGFLFLLIGIALALTLVPLQLDAAVAVAAIAEQRPRTFSLRGAYVQAFGLVNAIVAAGGVVGPLAAGSARIWIGWEGMAVAMGGLSLLIFGSVVVCMNGRKV